MRNHPLRTNIFALAAAISLAACDSMNVQQYRISGGVLGDAAKVKQILRDVARQTCLVDQTNSSRAPNTIAFYMRPEVKYFRVDVGARSFGEDILVDLIGGFGPVPPQFERAKRLLTPELTQAFGSRLSKPDFPHQIPLKPQ